MLSVLFLASCSEKTLDPISDSLGKPAKLTVDKVEPIAGGVTVTYTIPAVEDILAVKAVYTLDNGNQKETMVSYYDNQITLEGYNEMTEHTAEFYVLNRAQETSDAVKVSFTPLESPLSKTSRSVNIVEDFGGVMFSWTNEDQTPLTYEFLAQDSVGGMQSMRFMKSQVMDGSYGLRGYDTTPRRFGMILTDNFENRSDTIIGTYTPMFEEQLDRTKMRIMDLTGDDRFNYWNPNNKAENFLDGDPTTFGESNGIPASVTIDLGVTAKISRTVVFQRGAGQPFYAWGNPKQYEIYCFKGTGAPSQSGDWSEWELVTATEFYKPSGLPGKNTTDEDLAYVVNGHEYSFDISREPVRYLRFKFINTWENKPNIHPGEIEVYGEVKSE